jgi:uncharacterized membrane protein YeaQ/YmgE (transglycosylase-associated protein family)
MYQLALAILHHIPEGILMFMAGFLLTRTERPFRLTALLGTAYGLILTLARGLLPFGYHMPVVIGASIALFIWGARLPAGKGAFAGALTFVIIGISGQLVAAPVLTAIHIDLEDSLSSIPLSLLGAWLEDSLLILTVLVLLRWRNAKAARR